MKVLKLYIGQQALWEFCCFTRLDRDCSVEGFKAWRITAVQGLAPLLWEKHLGGESCRHRLFGNV